MIVEMYRKGEFREFPWIVRQYKPMEIHNITSLKNAISDQYGLLTKPKEEDRYLKIYLQKAKKKCLTMYLISLMIS